MLHFRRLAERRQLYGFNDRPWKNYCHYNRVYANRLMTLVMTLSMMGKSSITIFYYLIKII